MLESGGCWAVTASLLVALIALMVVISKDR